jgi:hypothetical protein
MNFERGPVVAFSCKEARDKMYCPRCGQQQVSDNVRFCSRCGFRLDFVTVLIYNDGLLPVSEETTQEKGRSNKRRCVRRGAKMMFLSGVLFPLALGMSIVVDGPGPLLLPFTVFLAGLAWMLYFMIFGDELPPATGQPQPRQYVAPPHRASLPPSERASVTGSPPRRVNTADLAQPPSVTDHTTKFFEEK